MNLATVYQIVNRRTKASYVGSCFSAPFGRWSAHVADLKLGRHPSDKFQSLWNQYPQLQDWSFEILQSGVPRDERLRWEQFWFEKLNPALNGTCKISRIVARSKAFQQVKEMLAAGANYRAIAQATGAAVGTITNWRRKMNDGDGVDLTPR
jgi:hypothetical protein